MINLLFLSITLGSALSFQSDPVGLADEFLARVFPESNIPGMAVSVISNGTLLYSRGFGKKNQKKDAVTPDTLFQIGSCTKTFIAIALALFVDSGDIKWDTPVIQVLPWFQANNTYLTNNLNIGDLLAHRSGLGNHNGDLLLILGGVKSEKELVERVRYLVPSSRLGLHFAYSNIGYEIATVVLEALSGKPWHEFVKEKLWIPLGMQNTFGSVSTIPTVKQINTSYGYFNVILPNEKYIESLTAFDMFDSNTPNSFGSLDFLGAGSILTSVNDYSKWMQFLLSPESYNIFKDSNILFTAESGQMIVDLNWASEIMLMNLFPVGNAMAAGFGFDVVGRIFHDHLFFTKGGDTGFYKSRCGFLPENNMSTAVFTNMQGSVTQEYYVGGMRNALLQIFSGATMVDVEREWNPINKTIQLIKQQMAEYNVSTLEVPLRDGKIEKYSYKLTLLIDDLNALVNATDVAGQLPFKPASHFNGTYMNKYYGNIVVEIRADGQLELIYGNLRGALSALKYPYFIWANATRRSLLMSGPPFQVGFVGTAEPQASALGIVGGPLFTRIGFTGQLPENQWTEITKPNQSYFDISPFFKANF